MKKFNTSVRTGNGKIAILGGSAEARLLADGLGARSRLWLPARDRVTGLGVSQDETFEACAQCASAIVVAPHPCDVESVQLGTRVAHANGVPAVTLMRPAWRPTRRDHWISVRTVSEAAVHIPAGARVLVTLGRPVLPELNALRHAHAFVRQLTRHTDVFPLRHGRYLFGTPPFTAAYEIGLMRRFRIDAVLTRNAGGLGGWPKIAAARALGLPVYLVEREKVSVGPVVTTVDAALDWCEAQRWSDD